ncbi:MAG: hypothetical protein ACR2GK_07705, partial [Gemmatimonadaceae bacterium]
MNAGNNGGMGIAYATVMHVRAISFPLIRRRTVEIVMDKAVLDAARAAFPTATNQVTLGAVIH